MEDTTNGTVEACSPPTGHNDPYTRTRALELAVAVHGRDPSPDDVLATARNFAAFIAG